MQHALVTCYVCTKIVRSYSSLVLKSNENLANCTKSNTNKQWVCKPCNSTLVNAIKCIACDQDCPKHKTIKYHASKYDMTDDIVQTTPCGSNNDSDYICTDCDRKLMTTNVCTCCHRKFNFYRVIAFNAENYNFEDYIVTHALASRHRSVHGDIYM